MDGVEIKFLMKLIKLHLKTNMNIDPYNINEEIIDNLIKGASV